MSNFVPCTFGLNLRYDVCIICICFAMVRGTMATGLSQLMLMR